VSKIRSHKPRLIVLTIVGFAVLLIASLLVIPRFIVGSRSVAWLGLTGQEFNDADFECQDRWYGLCGKNSITSIDDFRKTASNDAVLKWHFADFKWEEAHMGRLGKDTLAYVFYRRNGQVFRKKSPIKLPAGDQYITDGKMFVRTYCCNNYVAAVSHEDPSPAAGSEPLPSGGIMAKIESDGDRNPPRDTPEPITIITVVLGIPVFLAPRAYRRLRRKQGV
jgi:hypothetical protein